MRVQVLRILHLALALTFLGMAAPVAAQPLVTAGGDMTCAARAGQPLQCWGANYLGQVGTGGISTFVDRPAAVADMGPVQTVATQGEHSCATNPAGQVHCWGNNGFAQLGLGDTTNRTRATPVPGVDGAGAVSVGGTQSCTLRDGGVWCWGGAGTPAPRAIAGLEGATALSLSNRHACAIVGGQVRCWGAGTLGQLGDGRRADSATPVTVSGVSGAIAVSALGDATCAIAGPDRQLYCWGWNSDGRLGLGDQDRRLTAVPVPGLTGVVDVAMGGVHACAARADGQALCWGRNSHGQLGTNTGTGTLLTPTPVLDITGVSRVAVGANHSCAATQADELFCWGRNSAGQLGLGNRTSQTRPAPVSGYGTTDTVTTLTMPTQSVQGEPLRIDIAVTAAAGGGTPQGQISLRANGSEIAAATLGGSGTWRFPDFADLPAGTYTMTAHYLGAPGFRPSVSAPVTLTVAAVPAGAPSTTVLTGPTTGTAGVPMTFAARLTAPANPPGGFFFLMAQGYIISVATATAGGEATFTGPFPAGVHDLRAEYTGTGTGGPTGAARSLSAPLRLTVAGGDPGVQSTTVLTGPTQALQGQPVTFTARLTTAGGPVADQQILFYFDGDFAHARMTDATGTARLELPYMPLGITRVAARYVGGVAGNTLIGFSGSDDAPLFLTVSPGSGLIPTVTTLTGPASGVSGDPLEVVATVRATQGSAVPQGSVAILRNGAEVGRGMLAGDGSVRVTLTDLTAGTARLTARYMGSATHASSSSTVLPVDVALPRLDTTTTLTGPEIVVIAQGDRIQFNADVRGSDNSRPTGRVHFFRDGVMFADVSLLDGRASAATSTLPPGRHVITAVFQGATRYNPSTSNTRIVIVDAPGPLEFLGGGTVFDFTAACAAGGWPNTPQPARLRYGPGEVNGMPSQVGILFPSGAEHLQTWQPLAQSTLNYDALGRQMWTLFVLQQPFPRMTPVQRRITVPEGAMAITDAVEVMMRLRVSGFGGIPGCGATVAGVLRRGE